MLERWLFNSFWLVKYGRCEYKSVFVAAFPSIAFDLVALCTRQTFCYIPWQYYIHCLWPCGSLHMSRHSATFPDNISALESLTTIRMISTATVQGNISLGRAQSLPETFTQYTHWKAVSLWLNTLLYMAGLNGCWCMPWVQFPGLAMQSGSRSHQCMLRD